jgi:hypothetical protein
MKLFAPQGALPLATDYWVGRLRVLAVTAAVLPQIPTVVAEGATWPYLIALAATTLIATTAAPETAGKHGSDRPADA